MLYRYFSFFYYFLFFINFQHSLYVQKFNKANLTSRSLAFHISSNKFNKTNIENNKKIRKKENEISFKLSDKMLKHFKIEKVNLINDFKFFIFIFSDPKNKSLYK